MTMTSPINIAFPKGNPSTYPTRSCHVSRHSRELDFSLSPATHSSSIPKYGSSMDSTAPKPISVPSPNSESRPRRDSLAGSLTQGTSWGGLSLGSWIRDDVMMTGTSPYTYQLSSFSSSSFLPLLEDKYLRDFACCGSTIPSLHDLLQHYETTHVQPSQSMRTSYLLYRARGNPSLTNRLENTSQTPVAHRQSTSHERYQNSSSHSDNQNTAAPFSSSEYIDNVDLQNQCRRQQQQQQQQQEQESRDSRYFSEISSPSTNNPPSGLDEMDLDSTISSLDDLPDTPPMQPHYQSSDRLRQSHFGHLPQLSLDLSSTAIQYPGLRNSQPPTPASSRFSYQNNPTVSSVNTPTLSAQPMSQSQSFTPVTSGPGTPCGSDKSDSSSHRITNITDENVNSNLTNLNFPSLGVENTGNGYCIDEPAKRLYSPNGLNNLRLHQYTQLSQMHNTFYLNENPHQAQNSIALGHPHPNVMMMASEEHRPFRCPVIGCEKAYKNQNGLKYHKTHGHNSQQLHENGDGTFSIVNPETSMPFPGTLGMEKEKPYKCDCCTKRYKNLNGLKYHKQHTPACNPEYNSIAHLPLPNVGGMSNNISDLYGLGRPDILQ